MAGSCVKVIRGDARGSGWRECGRVEFGGAGRRAPHAARVRHKWECPDVRRVDAKETRRHPGFGALQVARLLVVPGDGRGTENRGRRGSEEMGLGG